MEKRPNTTDPQINNRDKIPSFKDPKALLR